MKLTMYNRLTIGVLGGSGRTGHPLIHQALEAGHEVIAVVRCAKKLHIEHPRLTVVEDNIFSHQVLLENFQDVDVVISTLGFPLGVQPVTYVIINPDFVFAKAQILSLACII